MSDRDTPSERRSGDPPAGGQGRRVGRYEVLAELGRGGMAVVYMARQVDLDRFVALKELGAFHATDPSSLQRFLREARLAGSLTHPNIVMVHESLEWEGLPYLSMEYIERGSLRPLVGRMTFPQIAGCLEAMLAGLSHAEEKGVVHRDLKPENLLITSDGRLKIADFGIAKAINRLATASGFATRTGTAIGTPAYMAPEQAMAHPIGPWTDLYTTGIIAYELVSGRVPFGAVEDEPLSVMFKHVQEPVPRPARLPADVPEATLGWMERLLEKDPGDRFATAAEAWDELEDIVLGAFGPRWRRAARLVDAGGSGDQRPLTPPSFHQLPDAALDDGYESFVLPESARPPGDAAPSVETPPSPEERPGAERPAPESVPPVAPPEPEIRTPAGVRTVPPHLPPPAAPIEREPEGPRRRLVPVVVAITMILAGVAGVLVGSRPSARAPAETVQSASTNDLQLSFSKPWRRGEGQPTARTLGFEHGVTLARTATPGVMLLADRTSARGPALVPSAISRRLSRAAGGGERLLLGRYEAVRHRGLRVAGVEGAITLYGVPTSNGVITIACVLPEPSDALAADCDRVAASVRLRRAKAYPVAPRPAYAAGVDAALRKLTSARGKALERLRTANTQEDQAAAATAAERAFTTARRQLAHLDVSPVDATAHAAILDAASRAASGFRAMAVAARSGRRSGYDGGRERALSGESAFARAIQSLGALGYEVST
jgi:serine/threonine protein kinase